MKKLKTLYLSCNNKSCNNKISDSCSFDYNYLTRFDSMAQIDSDTINLLRNDSHLILPAEIGVEEGPFTDPKISNYIFSELGDAFIDYSSNKHFKQDTNQLTHHSIHIGILSEDPGNMANFLKRNLFGVQAESENYSENQYNEMLAPHMIRDKEFLPYIYSPIELRKILSNLVRPKRSLDQNLDIEDEDMGGIITDFYVSSAIEDFLNNFHNLIKTSEALHFSAS